MKNPLETCEGFVRCRSCGEVDSFAGRADGVLLVIDATFDGQLTAHLDELPVDITVECECGAQCNLMDTGDGWKVVAGAA